MTPAQGDDASDDSDLSALLTESVDPRYADLDILSVAQLAELMNAADRTVPDAVHALSHWAGTVPADRPCR